MSGFDIIGDIHGQGSALGQLLEKLGYGGAYFSHPDGRKAIFIGDLLDRGGEHARTFDIVRRMQADGTAEILLGNHELNAICYAREGRRGYIRPHTADNTAHHVDFLKEYPFGTPAYREIIQWFESFPVYTQKRGFRAIHACWHENAIDVCAPYLRKDKSLKQSAYGVYDGENPARFRGALDILVKGPEYKLPRGVKYLDGQGHPRDKARLYWWEGKDAPHERLIQHGPEVMPFSVEGDKRRLVNLRDKFNYASQSIVFFGHYNIDTEPFVTAPRAVCVNFKHRLVAARWDAGAGKKAGGEFSPQSFVFV
ncbi:MAG: metallophosphoesterase [Micavibrio sp.]